MTGLGIEHRVSRGLLIGVHDGVYAVPPVLDDDRGRWMGATLTAPLTFLSHVSGAAAVGLWSLPRDFETVTRPGSGGPRRHGAVLVHRSDLLEPWTTTVQGIPITTVPRILIDLAPKVSQRALARCVRDAIRLGLCSMTDIADAIEGHRGRRGTRRLLLVLAAYADLPLARARSGAEVRALVVLRDAKRPRPDLNRRIAGEEADLSWPAFRLIIEIDGEPFHQDVGEDARKQAIWEAAGWTVLRVSSDDVYEAPDRLLAVAPPAERP